MASPTKAVPREKDLALSSVRYLVTQTPHFIGGVLVQPGAIVQLPEGVRPGAKLVAVGADGLPLKSDKPDKGIKAE